MRLDTGPTSSGRYAHIYHLSSPPCHEPAVSKRISHKSMEIPTDVMLNQKFEEGSPVARVRAWCHVAFLVSQNSRERSNAYDWLRVGDGIRTQHGE